MQNKKFIIGVWSLSGDYGYINEKNINKCLNKCLENKFFHFDTAPTYGNGDVNNILSKLKKNSPKILIDTKCGYNFSNKKTFKLRDLHDSIERSLELFENINCLYLHNPRKEIKDWEKVIDLLNRYKKKGAIKKIGISLARNFDYDIKKINKFDTIMDEFNLLEMNNLDRISKFKKEVVARSIFANGILTKKKLNYNLFERNDHRRKWLNKNKIKTVNNQIYLLNRILNGNMKLNSINLAISFKSINKIIIGIKNVRHVTWLKQNLPNFSKLSISKINHLTKLNNLNFFENLKNTY